MSCFDNLPREVRSNIYRFALEDTEVAELQKVSNNPGMDREWGLNEFLPPSATTRLRPRYCTNLFTVSKRISEESLEYFYKHNKFTAFEIPHDLVVRTVHSLIPLVIRNNSLRNEARAADSFGYKTYVHHVMLRARVSSYSHGAALPYDSGPKVLIFAAKHIPVFNRLLSIPWHDLGIELASMSMVPLVVLDWNLAEGKYHYPSLAVDQIIQDNAAFLKNHSLCRINVNGLCPEGWKMNLEPQWETTEGKTSPSQAFLDEVNFWISNGKAYAQHGHNMIASNYYQIVELNTRKSRVDHCVQGNSIKEKVDLAMLDLFQTWAKSLFARGKFNVASCRLSKAITITKARPSDIKNDQYLSDYSPH